MENGGGGGGRCWGGECFYIVFRLTSKYAFKVGTVYFANLLSPPYIVKKVKHRK